MGTLIPAAFAKVTLLEHHPRWRGPTWGHGELDDRSEFEASVVTLVEEVALRSDLEDDRLALSEQLAHVQAENATLKTTLAMVMGAVANLQQQVASLEHRYTASSEPSDPNEALRAIFGNLPESPEADRDHDPFPKDFFARPASEDAD